MEAPLNEFAGRATGNARPEVIHTILNEAGHGAWSRDRRAVVPLTPLQFALLKYLAQLPPHAVGRYVDIAEAMRPLDRYPLSDDRIRWHAANVRRLISSPECYRPCADARAWPPSASPASATMPSPITLNCERPSSRGMTTMKRHRDTPSLKERMTNPSLTRDEVSGQMPF
jgi:hypothetical protein